jgi:chromosome condensin MukBEF ATPase and DNA-binding subunit MukB
MLFANMEEAVAEVDRLADILTMQQSVDHAVADLALKKWRQIEEVNAQLRTENDELRIKITRLTDRIGNAGATCKNLREAKAQLQSEIEELHQGADMLIEAGCECKKVQMQFQAENERLRGWFKQHYKKTCNDAYCNSDCEECATKALEQALNPKEGE